MRPSMDLGGSAAVLLTMIGDQIHGDHHDASSETGSSSKELLCCGIEHASKNDACSK